MKRWESRNLGQTKEYLGTRITWDHKKRTISFWTKPAMRRKIIKWFWPKELQTCPYISTYRVLPETKLWPELVEVNTSQSPSVGLMITVIQHAEDKIRHILGQNSQFKRNNCRRRSIKLAISFLNRNSAWYSRTSDTNGLCAYSDTDWAGNVEILRSTTGYAIFLGNSTVSWLLGDNEELYFLL